MTTSLKRPTLSKPKKGEKIPPYTLSYVRARNRNKANSLLLRLFRDSGISKKEIADLLGKKPEQITRWLGGPGNLTLDTISDLVFAMGGDFIEISAIDELSKVRANQSSPEWISISSSQIETRVKAITTSEEESRSTSNTVRSQQRRTDNFRMEVQCAT